MSFRANEVKSGQLDLIFSSMAKGKGKLHPGVKNTVVTFYAIQNG